MSLTVGIDLGTTYSAVAYIDPETKQPRVIKNSYGFDTTPSALLFRPDGSTVIGIDAKNAEAAGDPNTASFYKLEMGKRDFSLEFFGKSYSAAELSGTFLRELISQAEKSIGDRIDKAVITVPAYFENEERNATIKAGESAGLDVLGIINEPTAAAIAYGLKDTETAQTVLIYDLGGGTFDVTLAGISKNSIEVIGSSGKHFLGGKNWDEAICNWAITKFEEEYGTSPADDPESFNLLMVKAEKAKRMLSSAAYADISVEYGGCSGKYRLTEEEFEDCTDQLLDITRRTIDELLSDTGKSWADIDNVVLVGGSTRMKMVRRYIEKMTGKPPMSGVDPDLAVALGAAIQAAIEERRRNAVISIEGERRLTLEGIAGAKRINDVIAHSLGMISVSADGSRFVNDIMIRKNTPLRDASVTKRRELPVSADENSNTLELYMLQGDAEQPDCCTAAKHLMFSGISYVEGGKSYIDITYSYTKNGIIDITAVQTETGRALTRQELDIPEDMSWTRLSPEEYFSSRRRTVEARGALYLALDVSGSMALSVTDDNRHAYSDRKNAMMVAQSAMKNFIRQFDLERIKIGVIAFSDKVKICCEATTDRRKIIKAIDDMKVGMTGIGNDSEPLTEIYRLLEEYKDDPFRYAVVLTDGAWRSLACQTAFIMKQKYQNNGCEIIGLGFGKADERFLREVSTRSELASVDSVEVLDERLGSIARVINDRTLE